MNKSKILFAKSLKKISNSKNVPNFAFNLANSFL